MVNFLAMGEEPAEFLGWDDAMLEAVARGGPESLWFWESPAVFVVVGLGQQVALEINLEACRRDAIPVLRRRSGGGAVVQGPGCLNYGLALRIPALGPLTTVTQTNQWIMARQAEALRLSGLANVVIRGTTDLAICRNGAEFKFSGNAQRRQKDALLFHGTILHAFDLTTIPRWLLHPTAEPAYRAQRRHVDFLTNVPLSVATIRRVMVDYWNAHEPHPSPPEGEMRRHAELRYSLSTWNLRR